VCDRLLRSSEAPRQELFRAWRKVKITTWTHKINGLPENDFMLAAEIDQPN